jgi:hypothetical protein
LGVFDPKEFVDCIEGFGVHGFDEPPGVGGFVKLLLLLLLLVVLLLLLLTGEEFGIDMGESIDTSTDFSRLGGGGCVLDGH